MAKPSSPLAIRAMASLLRPRGDALLLFLALASVLSLLSHELSRAAALASPHDFEGFDSDDLDADDDIDLPSPPPTTATTTTAATVSLSSESHHGPPSDPDPAPTPSAPPPSSLDYWDEDEFEGIPDPQPSTNNPDPIPQSPPSDAEKPAAPPQPTPLSLRSYAIEIVCVSFLIAFAINFFAGRRENERIALAWASKFATKDSIFEKNFSLLGTGDGKDTPLLLKEGQDVFKFYASGRRHCQSLLATMELRARYDFISRILDLVLIRKDTITFEVAMNEDAMDHVVLALARKKMAKAMHKEARDLNMFASPVTAPPAGRKWIADELMVVTESKDVAGDLITDSVLDQVFGEKAFEKFGKWFVSLHFSDQHPGSHRKMLVFKFALPDANNMAEMTRLVTLVPYYIDLIGRYKLSSQARSKTEAARTKLAKEVYKELQIARQEALQKKKAEKKKLMEEADAKLTAEAIRKREEKERARQLKKSMPRVKMLR